VDMPIEDEAVVLPIVDLDKLRDQQIRLHGLDETDIEATFYYDETNNFRSLSIGTGGLNVAELKVFVLGGVLHRGAQRSLDIGALRKAMWIQPSAVEIKLEHVAKGSFLDVLRSKKLATFFRWLTANDLLMHYHALDPFYWAIVDIVDSILPSVGNPMLLLNQGILKSDLNEVLRVDIPATVSLFHRHGYPMDLPPSSGSGSWSVRNLPVGAASVRARPTRNPHRTTLCSRMRTAGSWIRPTSGTEF
jgi:hypothetical protein